MLTIIVKQDNKAFTLIEVMIALIIFSVGMLALLSALGSIISINLENSIRDEGVKIAEESLSALRTNREPPANITRTIRGIPVGYTIVGQESPFGNLRQISVTVTWNFKGSERRHNMATISE